MTSALQMEQSNANFTEVQKEAKANNFKAMPAEHNHQATSFHNNFKYSKSLHSIILHIEIDLTRINYKQNALKKPLSNPNSLQFAIARAETKYSLTIIHPNILQL